jgi:hypothetical protein
MIGVGRHGLGYVQGEKAGPYLNATCGWAVSSIPHPDARAAEVSAVGARETEGRKKSSRWWWSERDSSNGDAQPPVMPDPTRAGMRQCRRRIASEPA